ncbi:hypothetical protein L3X38_044809 [Prunus dulcis]|uniref:Uncharacterized protein n=1 Tax=Prunus dulcis TaxID=3755 RepID=A0AAD4UZM9_PRUDU|nr:hypothetical protein L3X38_044809 [Prunus dulcis]
MMIASLCSSTGHLDVEKKRSIQILHGLERRLSKNLEKASFQKREASDLKTLVTNTFPNWCGYLSCKKYGYMKGRPQNWSPAEIRHAFVVYRYGARITIPKTLYEAKHLRTLLLIEDSSRLDNGDKIYSSFEYLRVLDLNHCDLVDMPNSLGDLICLRKENLESLGLYWSFIPGFKDSFTKPPNAPAEIDIWFPSLGELSISDIANLEEWSSANDGNAFCRLKKLIVKSCPKDARAVSARIAARVDFVSPRPARIADQADYGPLNPASLVSLRTLSIENCNELTSLSSSLEQLTLLEHLTIMYCPKRGSFPAGVQHISSLRSLIVLDCPCFDSMPEGLENVKTLHCLEMSSYPNLTALPEWFEIFGTPVPRHIAFRHPRA